MFDFANSGSCASEDPRLFDTMTRDGQTSKLGSVTIDGDKIPRWKQIARARMICRACPVNGPCLDYIRENPNPEGIWAGTLPDERLAWTRS